MIKFDAYIREKMKLHSIDEVKLYNAISKNKGIKEYFIALIGDREMFYDELESKAKELKLDIDDYTNVYVRFSQNNKLFEEQEKSY